MFDDKTKTEIVENMVHEVNRAYDEGYSDGGKIASKTKKEKSYEEGLQDAWNVARKLLSCTAAYIKRLHFNNEINLTATEVICDYNVFDVIKKMSEEATDSRVIKVGDEVEFYNKFGRSTTMYVTRIQTHSIAGNILEGITNSGAVISYIMQRDVHKTGKTNYKLRESLEDIKSEAGGKR